MGAVHEDGGMLMHVYMTHGPIMHVPHGLTHGSMRLHDPSNHIAPAPATATASRAAPPAATAEPCGVPMHVQTVRARHPARCTACAGG